VSTRARPRPPVASRPGGSAPPARARGAPTGAGQRRRRRLLVTGIALAVLLAVAYGVAASPLLAVDRVQIRGLDRLTASDIENAGGVHDGDAMVWIDTSGAVQGIEALPYVREASLTREWPHTVRITVRERTPSAWVDAASGKALVDGTGRVLELVDAAPAHMPQLLGAKLVPPPGGTVDAVGAARVAGALHGLAALGTASVAATDHGVVLKLASGPEIRMGEPSRIAVKLRAGFAVLAACDGKAVEYVDVSVPTNPVAGGC
jgi:cell division protein FtsQ